VSVTPEQIVVRLLLALVFGAAIGLERQWHHKPAGVKTHTLVALGSTTFSLVSVLGLGPNSAPTQLAVGVVTGIGFIGGGVIMRKGGAVQGITTAATLWATASAGLALGPGYYFLTAALFVGILAVEVAFRTLDYWIDERSSTPPGEPTHQLSISFTSAGEAAVREAVNGFISQHGVAVCRSSQVRSTPLHWELKMALTTARSVDFAKLGRDLASSADVLRVDWGACEDEGS
jgi:putative Mg2+ transporter-C (MgtC) family protein